MKLMDSFFTIVDFEERDGRLEYIIELNPSHSIYEAHFPGNPVTPGVCIIRTVQELVKDYMETDLFMQSITKAKFLHVINPLEHGRVNVSIVITTTEENAYKVDATVFDGELTFAQLTLILVNV